MKLTVLGKYGPFPKESGATSSYLLSSEKANVLIDAGSGSFSRLVKNVSIDSLSFVILSHLHFDHTADMGVLSYALAFSKRKEKLNVYLPKFDSPVLKMLESIKEFNLIFIEEGKTYNDSGLEFSFYKMTHPVLCYGVRILGNKSVFAYSGDTTVNDNIEKLVFGADLAVLDGAFLEKDYLVGKPHMSVKQASSYSRFTKGKVIVSHIGYAYSDSEVQEEIKSVSKNSEIAEEGKVYKF